MLLWNNESQLQWENEPKSHVEKELKFLWNNERTNPVENEPKLPWDNEPNTQQGSSCDIPATRLNEIHFIKYTELKILLVRGQKITQKISFGKPKQ